MLLTALPALAQRELDDGSDRREYRVNAPPGDERRLLRFRDESGPAYEVAATPAPAEAPRPAVAPPESLVRAEDRLPPETAEIELGWWRVGLDWRRHPGVCLIDP